MNSKKNFFTRKRIILLATAVVLLILAIVAFDTRLMVRKYSIETEEIETEKAVGRIAARLNLPCPPCIALAVPGEIIDEKIAALLIKYGIDKINVVKKSLPLWEGGIAKR